MKKTFVLTIAMLISLLVEAQVTMTLQTPPLGLTIKPQLWNLTLINTSDEPLSVRIEMELTDISTGLRVFRGTSRMLALARGTKLVRQGDVMPVVYEAGNPGYVVNLSPDGFLPIGVFNACYTVLKVNNDAPEVLTEECVTLEVEPLSPPQLVIPSDSEQVELTRPFFSWMPPAPVNSFGTMLYDWILVEVQPTQSAPDAIQQNIPVFTQQNISQTTLQYPMSMPALDSTKLYAWRIIAKNINSPVATSEIWTFRIRRTDQGSAAAPASYFAKLQREEHAAFTICTGVLRFEFDNDRNAPSAAIRIFDISSKQRKPVVLDSAEYAVKYGQNFIQLDLGEAGNMVNKHMYLLELTTATNEKRYLRFEFRKNND